MMMKTALIVSALAVVATYALPEAVVPEVPEAETTNFLSAMAFGRSKSKSQNFDSKTIQPVIQKLKDTLKTAKDTLDDKENNLKTRLSKLEDDVKDAKREFDAAIDQAKTKLKTDSKSADDALGLKKDTYEMAKDAYKMANATFSKAEEANDDADATNTNEVGACASAFETATSEARRTQQEKSEESQKVLAKVVQDAEETKNRVVKAAKSAFDSAKDAAQLATEKAAQEAEEALAKIKSDADATLTTTKTTSLATFTRVKKLHASEKELADEMVEVAKKIKGILEKLGNPEKSNATWVLAILAQLDKAKRDAGDKLKVLANDVQRAKGTMESEERRAMKARDATVSEAADRYANIKAEAKQKENQVIEDAERQFNEAKSTAEGTSKDKSEEAKKDAATRAASIKKAFETANETADATKVSCQNDAKQKLSSAKQAYKEAEKAMNDAKAKWTSDEIIWDAAKEKASLAKKAVQDAYSSEFKTATDKLNGITEAKKRLMAEIKKEFEDAKATHESTKESIEKVVKILKGLNTDDDSEGA